MLSECASVVEEVDAVPTFNLPLLVRAVGAILACSAGLINSVAYFELEWFVSHQTGNLSKVGFGNMEALAVLLSFVAGSVACGLFIAKDTVHIGLALYDFGLLSISGLLIAATLMHHNPYAKFFAAAACGLQNGMATFWGGAVVRTTHVTGLFTDVGLLIGRLLSLMARKRFGKRFDSIDRVEVVDGVNKLCFLGVLAVSFLLGIIIGANVHGAVHEYAFLVPAAVVGTLGMAYLVHRVFILKQKLFSDTEMELVDIPVHAVIEEDAFAQQSSVEEGRARAYSTDAKRRIYTTGRGRSFSASSSGDLPGLAAPMRVISEDSLRHVAVTGIVKPGSPSGGTVTLAAPSGDWVSVTRRCALQRQGSQQQGAHNFAAGTSSREIVEQLQTVPE